MKTINLYKSTSMLNIYLLFGMIFMVIIFMGYFNNLISRLEKESTIVPEIYAKFCSKAATTSENSENVDIIFEEIIKRINFPVIITDIKGEPTNWTGVGIDALNPTGDEIKKLREMTQKIARHKKPVDMILEPAGIKLGKVYVGESPLVREVRWVPVIMILSIMLFVVMGFIGYRTSKQNEEKAIWIGMARETAHQLGTPISSLGGWLELLTETLEINGEDKHKKELTQEIERDIQRLSIIASRFGKIGSVPEYKRQPVNQILADMVDYFRQRTPKFAHDVIFMEDYGQCPELKLNRELMEWAVENLIKNALDAIVKGPGRISLSTELGRNGKFIEIRIGDNGRGMTIKEQRKAFKPGYSTKRLGWGIGLALVKRIIEDYHGGKVFIKDTQLNKGTVFQINLPVKEQD